MSIVPIVTIAVDCKGFNCQGSISSTRNAVGVIGIKRQFWIPRAVFIPMAEDTLLVEVGEMIRLHLHETVISGLSYAVATKKRIRNLRWRAARCSTWKAYCKAVLVLLCLLLLSLVSLWSHGLPGYSKTIHGLRKPLRLEGKLHEPINANQLNHSHNSSAICAFAQSPCPKHPSGGPPISWCTTSWCTVWIHQPA